MHYDKTTLTLIFEDNKACIEHLNEGYIKGDKTKHISPKFFISHDLQENGEIEVRQIRSSDNLVDLSINSLAPIIFEKLVHMIGMRCLKDLKKFYNTDVLFFLY